MKKIAVTVLVFLNLMIISSGTLFAAEGDTKSTIWRPAETDYYQDSYYMHDLVHNGGINVSIDVSSYQGSNTVEVGYYNSSNQMIMWDRGSSTSPGGNAGAYKNYDSLNTDPYDVYQYLF